MLNTLELLDRSTLIASGMEETARDGAFPCHEPTETGVDRGYEGEGRQAGKGMGEGERMMPMLMPESGHTPLGCDWGDQGLTQPLTRRMRAQRGPPLTHKDTHVHNAAIPTPLDSSIDPQGSDSLPGVYDNEPMGILHRIDALNDAHLHDSSYNDLAMPATTPESSERRDDIQMHQRAPYSLDEGWSVPTV
ncbi:hypothetical protein BDV93DRAFT_511925 [Ceratobasidium sp. AG-I]|nr:hypothetical protein BDV93DRAFT_511925 [Ceratobasidium sp. AG-I]